MSKPSSKKVKKTDTDDETSCLYGDLMTNVKDEFNTPESPVTSVETACLITAMTNSLKKSLKHLCDLMKDLRQNTLKRIEEANIQGYGYLSATGTRSDTGC